MLGSLIVGSYLGRVGNVGFITGNGSGARARAKFVVGVPRENNMGNDSIRIMPTICSTYPMQAISRANTYTACSTAPRL